jgi:hypothetical protein
MPLAEPFLMETLQAEGVEEARARLAARMSGWNMGRARRMASDPEGLAFRDAALAALAEASRGPGGALDAVERLTEAGGEYRKRLAGRLVEELEPFLEPETGQPLEQYRGAVRRMEARHRRLERRAEREFLDSSLLALEAWFRDGLLREAGGEPDWAINLDLESPAVEAPDAARAVEVLEQARAALADETNLNPRLVLEEALLSLPAVAPTG